MSINNITSASKYIKNVILRLDRSIQSLLDSRFRENDDHKVFCYRSNNKGVTLIEVMISLVVLLLVFLGLMQTALLSIDSNVRNVFREEAINVASESMNELQVVAFGDPILTAGTNCQNPPAGDFTRNFRNLTKTFRVCNVITDLDANTKSVEVAVGWDHKNETAIIAPTGREFQHSITTVRRR